MRASTGTACSAGVAQRRAARQSLLCNDAQGKKSHVSAGDQRNQKAVGSSPSIRSSLAMYVATGFTASSAYAVFRLADIRDPGWWGREPGRLQARQCVAGQVLSRSAGSGSCRRGDLSRSPISFGHRMTPGWTFEVQHDGDGSTLLASLRPEAIPASPFGSG